MRTKAQQLDWQPRTKKGNPPFVDELDRSIAVDTDLALARCEEAIPQLALQMSLENQHSPTACGTTWSRGLNIMRVAAVDTANALTHTVPDDFWTTGLQPRQRDFNASRFESVSRSGGLHGARQ